MSARHPDSGSVQMSCSFTLMLLFVVLGVRRGPCAGMAHAHGMCMPVALGDASVVNQAMKPALGSRDLTSVHS